jgi:hypothetical protein
MVPPLRRTALQALVGKMNIQDRTPSFVAQDRSVSPQLLRQLACLTGVSLTFLAGLAKRLPLGIGTCSILAGRLSGSWRPSVSVISAHWHSPPEAAGIDVFVTTGRNVSYDQQNLLAATSPSCPRQGPVGLTKHRLPTGTAAVAAAMDGQLHRSRDRARLKTVCNHSH